LAIEILPLWGKNILFVLVRLQVNHLIHPAAQEKPDSALSCYLPYAFLLLPAPRIERMSEPRPWLSLSKQPGGVSSESRNWRPKKTELLLLLPGENNYPVLYSKLKYTVTV
jgi:hypothetical protein